MVALYPDPRDGRGRIVRLTEFGEKVFAIAREAWDRRSRLETAYRS
jgi:DNA-binding MarR family transcriptional regulator